MKTLNVMSLDFTYKAALRGYESAVLKRAWNGIGSLELVISAGITNAEKIDTDDILWFDNETHKAYIVERIESALEGGTEKLYITAKGIESLLADFITIPAAGTNYDIRTGTREAVVRGWVDANCISPADADRAQYPIVLGSLYGFGSSITEQTRYKNLSEEICRVLVTEDLGWGLEIDIDNKQFVFKVYKGKNRTSIQSENSRILFGLRYGNVSGFHRVSDNLAARTVAYVGGQGEGSVRTITTVELEDTRRREVFVEARDVAEIADLAERGLQALAETEGIKSYEFEILNRQFTYETDYDLGDYVTVVTDKNECQHLQIKSIKEVYEAGNISIVPEFGIPEREIGNIINSLSDRIANLETNEIKGLTDDEQIIEGVKTFTAFPVTPSQDPIEAYHVANKQYVDKNKGLLGFAFTRFETDSGTAVTASFDSTGQLEQGIVEIGTDKFTITKDGYVEVNVQWRPYTAFASGEASIIIRKNGSDVESSSFYYIQDESDILKPVIPLGVILRVSSGDDIDFRVSGLGIDGASSKAWIKFL